MSHEFSKRRKIIEENLSDIFGNASSAGRFRAVKKKVFKDGTEKEVLGAIEGLANGLGPSENKRFQELLRKFRTLGVRGALDDSVATEILKGLYSDESIHYGAGIDAKRLNRKLLENGGPGLTEQERARFIAAYVKGVEAVERHERDSGKKILHTKRDQLMGIAAKAMFSHMFEGEPSGKSGKDDKLHGTPPDFPGVLRDLPKEQPKTGAPQKLKTIPQYAPAVDREDEGRQRMPTPGRSLQDDPALGSRSDTAQAGPRNTLVPGHSPLTRDQPLAAMTRAQAREAIIDRDLDDEARDGVMRGDKALLAERQQLHRIAYPDGAAEDTGTAIAAAAEPFSGMAAATAQRKIDLAKHDEAFRRRLLRGERNALNRMHRLFATAYPKPDSRPGETHA